MKKVIRPGTVNVYGNEFASLFCKIEFVDNRLSITGVVGPTRNGNAMGGCGQVVDELRNVSTFAPGWTPELAEKLRQVWDRWHLNDMRAGCEHQRERWNPREEIELVTYQLTSAALSEQHALKRRIESVLAAAGAVSLTPEEHALYILPFHKTSAPNADGADSGRYEVKSREKKIAGWVTPEEHPSGLLTKPCEVCGYKYGTSWLREDVPAEVLAFLEALPATDIQPAWV